MTPKPYTVYQGIDNKRKSYVAVSRWEWANIKEDQAIKIANKHFKVKADQLKCEKGYIVNRDLYLGNTKSPTAHKVWVISKKCGKGNGRFFSCIERGVKAERIGFARWV